MKRGIQLLAAFPSYIENLGYAEDVYTHIVICIGYAQAKVRTKLRNILRERTYAVNRF